eukprot:5945374-Amphidinium_carterae.1
MGLSLAILGIAVSHGTRPQPLLFCTGKVDLEPSSFSCPYKLPSSNISQGGTSSAVTPLRSQAGPLRFAPMLKLLNIHSLICVHHYRIAGPIDRSGL